MRSLDRAAGRQTKSVPFAYGGVAATLLLVIAALALVVVPPAPPSIAEFAPTVDKQIDEAPPSQSSRFGAGEGSCAEGQQCEAAAEEAEARAVVEGRRKQDERPVDKNRVRRCVGNPPRQIEDPQSPPCVNYWEGDNSGATAPGVTRDEIRVAWPDSGALAPAGPALDLFVDFFNERFEFYGRQIRLVRYKPSGDVSPEGQPADAETVKSLRVFASGPYSTPTDGSRYFHALAQAGVVSVAGVGERTSEEELSADAPYRWTYLPTIERLQDSTGEWVCRTLKGRTAQWAGPGTVGKVRKFGLAYNRSIFPSVLRLRKALDACGAPYDVADLSGNDYARATTIVSSWQLDGVTSILCVCPDTNKVPFFNAADDGNYFPEWLLMPLGDQDVDRGKQTHAHQRAREFGLTATNKWNRLRDMPWYWAAREADPDYHEGDDSVALGAKMRSRSLLQYWPLLLLASGIQMAGPNLTPETFEQGLFKARFPNPGAGAGPYYQGSVGFGPGDHSMVDDLAALWYDQAAESYERTMLGSHCYVGLGTRWSVQKWPDRQLDYFEPTRCK